MPDGVEVDVVKVGHEVGFVANRVFPEARLPDATIASLSPLLRDLGLLPAAGQPVPGEVPFDSSPPRGEIVVSVGHGPYCVKVIGKQYDGRQIEGIRLDLDVNCGAKDAPRERCA